MGYACGTGLMHERSVFATHAQEAGLSITEQQLHLMLRRPESVFLVVRADACAVGFLLGHSLFDACEIYDVLVLPEHRRQGCASMLVQHMANHVATLQQKLVLEVADDNLEARALYDKLGFTAVDIRRGYYGRRHRITQKLGVDAWVMQRGAR